MVLLIGVGALALLITLFALLTIVPFLPEVVPAEPALSGGEAQLLVQFPTDRSQAA